MCPCACPAPDASVDAPVDAPPPPIDLAVPWTRTTLTAGAATGPLRGADGVAFDVDGCIATAWEEGGSVTRWCDGAAETVATGLIGPEDSKAADLDGDGAIDVVTAADAGARVYVTFREPSGNTTITLTASQGHGRVMQVAPADVDADGNTDIVFGTRLGTPSVVAWLRNPGPANARLSVWWDYHEISLAGWVMSLVPRDVNSDSRMDIVVSDRAKQADGSWALYGARWMEQMSDGTWLGHAISLPAGSCSPYASTACQRTPGDEMFLSVLDNDVYDCTSAAAQSDSRITIHHTTDWLTWTHVTLPPVANVGHCQGVLPMDVDLDGDMDLVVTTWKGNAYPIAEPGASKSGVYWLRNNGDGTYSRGEVSGPEGGKYDNAIQQGRCIVTSEQLDPEGGLGVVRFCP